MKSQQLPVAMLEVCDRARVRQQKPKDGSDIVLEYAEAYQCGLIMEPLDVFRERGTERYIIADGEHRLLALRRTKIKEVECRVHEGDEIAALDFAIGCNQKHGVRRTDRDKYHALARIMETSLRDSYRTDTQLSEKIGISIATVKRYKAQWRSSEGGDERVSAKKKQAQSKAQQHTSSPVVNGSREPFHAPVSVAENSSTTRIGVLNDAPKSPKPVPAMANGAGTHAREALASLDRFSKLPPASQVRAALNGEIDWDCVEIAHAWLSDLLSER